jgi:C4-dicarboxylate transporter DctM subunit
MLILFLFLAFIRVPIAFAMLLSGVVAIAGLGGVSLLIVPQRLYLSLNSFTLMAVPFFILAGLLMNAGGITKRLVNLSSALIGHFRGGLAQVNILTSMLFAGISGSASADAAAIGAVMIPAMTEDGYDKPFSVGVTASSACIGPIIPPSIVMVIYGSLTNLSIAALFIAGIIPGIMIGLSLMLVVWLYARKRGYRSSDKASLQRIMTCLKEASWGLFTPIIILGGILSGAFTATEAGVVACVYSFIVGVFIYRELKFKQLRAIIINAAVTTSVAVLILAGASIFGWVLAFEQFSTMLVNFLSAITSNPQVVYILLAALLFVVGLFIEGLAATIIFIPALTPIAAQMGYDPIHFALVVIITVLIGTVTPPVGLQLYIACAVAKISISKATVWAFVGAMVCVLLLVIYFPPLTTYLPKLLLR